MCTHARPEKHKWIAIRGLKVPVHTIEWYIPMIMGSRPEMNVCVALLSKYNALSLFLTQMYEWFVAFIDNWDGIKS